VLARLTTSAPSATTTATTSTSPAARRQSPRICEDAYLRANLTDRRRVEARFLK
jgi:hypothetical protein